MLVAVRRASVRLLAACSFAFAVSAQEAATVAKLVQAPTVDAAQLATALASADQVTRATAARVALVRGVDAILPRLREVLAKETNAEAAREEVRTLALLGSEEDVAFTVKQLPRFPSSIDLDFSEAIARRGAPEATTLYLRHRGELRLPAPFPKHALWGRASLATPTASRLLGADDAGGFGALLQSILASEIDVDPGIITAALGTASPRVRADTVWYLVQRYAAATEKMPERAGVAGEGLSVDEAFGREIVRRMRGAEHTKKPEWIAWLRTPEGRTRVPGGKAVRRHLSLDEQNALEDENGPPPAGPQFTTKQGQGVAATPFFLAINLPTGLAAQLLQQARCPGSWIGSGAVSVDRAGRVQSVDLGGVKGEPRCTEALETMLRLTLADPRSMVAPMAAAGMQLVSVKEQPCLDEDPVMAGGSAELLRPGALVKAPKAVRRVEPQYPARLRQQKLHSVVLTEALISRTGCLRDIRVISQSEWPELNTSAVVAISKWKFEPGTLDGQPVDVLFNLIISFNLN
jgi:TonB family protein